jgi:membrane-associated PAP2 superfamily phosphatase
MTSIRAILAALALLAVTLIIFESSSIDLLVQDAIYAMGGNEWPVDEDAPVPMAIFYIGPKIALVVFALVLLAMGLIDRLRHGRLTRAGRVCVYILLCLATFPPAVAGIKAVSRVHCPSQVARYGGKQPYRQVFAPFPPGCCDPKKPGKCFPAGHATGGFALMALGFAARSRSGAALGIAIGLVAGWTMGLYQMLKGDHFLSHTIVTMILAFIFCQVIARLTRLS